MVKLLVSDYDGTYNINEYSIKKNNAKIKEFVQEHRFAISTGRNYEEFVQELQKNDLIADYFSLMDGNVLLDYGLNIIHLNKIPKGFISFFRDYYSLFESLEMLDAYGEKGFSDIAEVKILYKNLEAKKQFINYLLENRLYCYHHNYANSLECHISNPSGNKIDTINKISTIDKISKSSIYTIGDNYNDVEMIKRFKGYAIFSAKQDVKNIANGEYNSVADLAEDIRGRRI